MFSIKILVIYKGHGSHPCEQDLCSVSANITDLKKELWI
jgi:hypothetical protein